ncbi:MAG: carbohydrate ABC transporter permease [Anaerolineae bacterium]
MLRTRPWTPYLYLTPASLLMLFVFGYPLVAIFDFSMRRIRGASGPFIGLENYRQIFKDEVFQQAILHNAQLLLAVPILVLVGIVLAVLLYERVAGWRIYRTTLFAPFIIAIPVIGIVFSNMLSLNGAVNELLRAVGLDFLALDWLGSAQMALWSVMAIIIWHEMGLGVVLFLARLLSLNEEIQEAARIDGAGWWQRLWYVTIPQLKDVTEFYAVVSVITMLAWVFPFVYVMTRGGPGNATQVMELYIFNFAFRNSLPGIASAVAVILFLITLALMIPLFQLRARTEMEGIE